MSTTAPFPHQNTPDASTTSGLSEPDGAATQAASTTDQKSTDLQTIGAWDSFFLTGMNLNALSGEEYSLFQ